MIDILYVSWNRLEFTRFSFDQLLRNTDWSLVDRLVVWDDYSTDGTIEYLQERIVDCPVDADLRVGGYRSPVKIMGRYIEQYTAPLFAKVDNDIVVPPGWLVDLLAVMEANPELDLLGTQSAFTNTPGPPPTQEGSGPHTFVPAAHIGGVGLMRREAFTSRPSMSANGRFGFTHWQERHEPCIGWITPDLHITCLDQVPFAPWEALSARYTRLGWQRPNPWPLYKPDHYSWEWWPSETKAVPS